jgi:hypothetical protein
MDLNAAGGKAGLSREQIEAALGIRNSATSRIAFWFLVHSSAPMGMTSFALILWGLRIEAVDS